MAAVMTGGNMKTLTREKELQILKAADEVVDLVNQGTTPDDALFKVATDHQLLPAFVNRLAETFNTSRMLSHLKTASPEKRADEFPLASAAVVLNRMYPEDVTGDKAKQARCHSTWFNSPPNFTGRVLEKAAAPPTPLVPTADKKLAFDLLIKRALNHTSGLKRQVEVAQDDSDYCRELLSQAVLKAAAYFRSLDHVPFEVIESNVLTKHGSIAKHLMSAIFTACNGTAFNEKRGQAYGGERVAQLDVEPYGHVDEALRWAKKWAESEAEKRAAADELSDFKAQLKERTDKLADAGRERIPFPFGKAKSAGSTMPLIVGGSALGERLGRMYDDPTASAKFESQVQGSVDPDQVTNIRAARTKAMLSELMTNDPVISGFDPEKVLGAFNEISAMSPRVAEQPGVLRGMLARQLEMGRTEPFEAEQTINMESKLQRMEAPIRYD